MTTTMKVETKVNEGFKTDVICSHPFTIDQPKPMGGSDMGANPLEFFLSSLGGCICAIGRIIARQERLNVRMIDVVVEGDIDKDFLLGKTEEGRAGFQEIRLHVDVDADMTTEEKQEFLEKIGKRCPIADNVIGQSVIKTLVA